MTFQPPIVPARTSGGRGASAYCGYAVVVGGTFASPSPWLATIPLIEGHIFVQSCFFSQTDPLSTVRHGFLSHLVSDAPAVVEIFKEICKATLHTKGVDLQTWSWRATPPSCGGQGRTAHRSLHLQSPASCRCLAQSWRRSQPTQTKLLSSFHLAPALLAEFRTPAPLTLRQCGERCHQHGQPLAREPVGRRHEPCMAPHTTRSRHLRHRPVCWIAQGLLRLAPAPPGHSHPPPASRACYCVIALQESTSAPLKRLNTPQTRDSCIRGPHGPGALASYVARAGPTSRH